VLVRAAPFIRTANRLLLAAMVLLALALLVELVMVAVQLLDPGRPVRELALRDARAMLEHNDAQVWQDHSPCWQAHNPKAQWLHEQVVLRHGQEGQAPADTRYSVIAMRSDGVYKRVEVRVQLPAGYALTADYEVDVRQYGGRWVVVDHGDLGHPIGDDCARGRGE
jgi:hypothetical protein